MYTYFKLIILVKVVELRVYIVGKFTSMFEEGGELGLDGAHTYGKLGGHGFHGCKLYLHIQGRKRSWFTQIGSLHPYLRRRSPVSL